MNETQYREHLRGVIEYLVLQQVKRGECYTLPDGECWGVECVHVGKITGQPDPPPTKKVSRRRLQ
jgi:hypothetical protein